MDESEQRAGLRYILRQWDPFEVAESGPDPYESLLDSLAVRLRAGGDRADIAGFLQAELERHPELELEREDIDAMAGEFVAWWGKPRERRIRYWLRRPEPSVALGSLFALALLVGAIPTRDWGLTVVAGVTAAATVFVWWGREVWRYNAEEWRHRRGSL